MWVNNILKKHALPLDCTYDLAKEFQRPYDKVKSKTIPMIIFATITTTTTTTNHN